MDLNAAFPTELLSRPEGHATDHLSEVFAYCVGCQVLRTDRSNLSARDGVTVDGVWIGIRISCTLKHAGAD